MTQDTRTIENKLKWSQDQQSANTVIQSNKAIADSFKSIQTQTAAETLVVAKLQQGLEGLERSRVLQQLARDAAAGVTPLDQVVQKLDAMNASDAELIRLAKDMDTFAINAQKAAVATQQIAATPRGVRDIGIQSQDELPFPDLGGDGGGGGRTAIGNLRQAAISLPGIGFQSPVVVGLSAVDKLAQKTGASLGEMALAGGIAGVALIALTVALQHFKEEIAADKVRLDGALAANKNYYTAVQTLTTEQATEQISTLQRSRQALQENAGNLEAALKQSFDAASQGLGGQLSARVNDALGNTPYQQLKAAADEANKAVQENIDTETRLTQGRDSGAFAANDAVEAEKALQKAREESAGVFLDKVALEAQTRTELAQLRRTGTTDQINAELDANREREILLQNFVLPHLAKEDQSLKNVSDATEKYNIELDNLKHRDELLVDAVRPVVAQREAEVNLLKAQKDASDALNPILQDINKSQVDLGNSAEKTRQAWVALQQADTDHTNKLTDIQATYDEASRNALQKKNEQIAKIDANAATRALEQRENLNLQIEGLVGRGQIAEAQLAIRSQKLKETQDARQVQTQKDDAQKTYSDQLKAAEEQRVKLLRSEQERYAKERQQRQEAHRQAIEDEYAVLRRLEQLNVQKAFQEQYNANVQIAALAKVSQATGNYAANMKSYAAQINANIQAGGAAWKPVNSTGWATTGSNSSGGHLPGEVVGLPAVTGTAAMYPKYGSINVFDTPSYNTRPGLYESRVPEYHIPAADFNRMGNMGGGTYNVSVTLNAQGSNMSPAERQRLKDETKTETIQALTAVHTKQKKGGRG